MTLFVALSACLNAALQGMDAETREKLFPHFVVVGALCENRKFCECIQNMNAAIDGLSTKAVSEKSGFSEAELTELTSVAKSYRDQQMKMMCTDPTATKLIPCMTYCRQTTQFSQQLAEEQALTVTQALFKYRAFIEREKKLAEQNKERSLQLQLRNRLAMPQSVEYQNGRLFVTDSNGTEYEKVGEKFYPAVYRQPK
jgi:hypothetical protein